MCACMYVCVCVLIMLIGIFFKIVQYWCLIVCKSVTFIYQTHFSDCFSHLFTILIHTHPHTRACVGACAHTHTPGVMVSKLD